MAARQHMNWKIIYYSHKVKCDSARLHKSVKAKLEAIMDKMLEYGPDLGMPFTRPMGKGLFEIRAQGREGAVRG